MWFIIDITAHIDLIENSEFVIPLQGFDSLEQ